MKHYEFKRLSLKLAYLGEGGMETFKALQLQPWLYLPTAH